MTTCIIFQGGMKKNRNFSRKLELQAKNSYASSEKYISPRKLECWGIGSEMMADLDGCFQLEAALAFLNCGRTCASKLQSSFDKIG